MVVIGGGIAGLSTAWYLRSAAARAGLNLRCTVFEAEGRAGGHVMTETIAGPDGRPFVIEGGPDSFLTQKPWAAQLARELGLGDRLLGTNDELRRVFVLNRGRPMPLPDGVLLIVPTRFMPFALSPLISPLGKLRMAMDLVKPARADDEDETLADFVRRRLGSEALDKIAEPLLSGIYNSEAERQSLLATFPRFRDLERRHGSLTRGMLASKRERARKPADTSAGGQAPTLFMSLRGGTAELTDALAARLGADLRTGDPVTAIGWNGGGRYAVESASGTTPADAVVLATPAYVAAGLLRTVAPDAAPRLAAIRYVSTGTISLAYRLEDIGRPLRGFGLVIPRSERRPINAITWSSLKFNDRAPAGQALLRVFFGGSRSPASMDLDDEALLAMVRVQMRELMGIEAAPLLYRIYRWRLSNAQYDVGHLDRVSALEAALPPGLYVTGSAYRGVGLPDCVKQAQDTADKILVQLQENAS